MVTKGCLNTQEVILLPPGWEPDWPPRHLWDSLSLPSEKWAQAMEAS